MLSLNFFKNVAYLAPSQSLLRSGSQSGLEINTGVVWILCLLPGWLFELPETVELNAPAILLTLEPKAPLAVLTLATELGTGELIVQVPVLAGLETAELTGRLWLSS
jgi:hypothetical protein